MSHQHSEMKREIELEEARKSYFKVHGVYESDEIINKWFESLAIHTFSYDENMILDDVKEKPKHYDIGIDTFTRMRANATFEEAMGFIRWNIDKYNTRAKGQDEEDYKKIEAYCKEAMWWFVNRRAKE